MRTPIRLLGLSATSALIAALVPANLQAGIFERSLAELSTPDREAMERARREVLEKMEPGAVSVWKGEKTGHSGEAHLLRTYERNGMSCAEVVHVLKFPEVSRYVIPFCRAGDGTWRTAF